MDIALVVRVPRGLRGVVRIEFTPATADEILAGHTGTEVDYAVNLWSRTF